MTQDLTLVDAGPRAVDLWNRTEERALINLVPGAVGRDLMKAAEARPEFFGQDDRTLYKLLRENGQQPNATDNRLRISFWMEYDRAQTERRQMDMSAVVSGVCSKQYFYERYLTAPAKAAWLVTPPSNYVVVAQEALTFGLEELRDILELSHVLPNGRVDTKLAELKAKIVAMLDQRVKGAVTQRIEQKNMNLNVTTTDAAVAHKVASENMEDLEKRLKELERRERRALNLPESSEPIDIEVQSR